MQRFIYEFPYVNYQNSTVKQQNIKLTVRLAGFSENFFSCSNSFDFWKLRPIVLEIFIITGVESLSTVAYLGSGKSPMNLRIVIQSALEA